MYGTAYRDALNRTLALEEEYLYGPVTETPPPAPAAESAPAKAPKAARNRAKSPLD